jgi:hypothetical protein
MSADQTYVKFEPGGLITAESMNDMQARIAADIAARIAAALAALTEIANAGDSDKLEGLTVQELLEQFLEKAMQELPKQTGYRKLFKRLPSNEWVTIEHMLATCPLVDVYELLDFQVVCAHDAERVVHRVRFFLYHSSEKKIRHPSGGGSVTIEEIDGPVYRIPLAQMLSLLAVDYNEKTSVQDLEEELWSKMFSDPNDDFDPEERCHSPWFERCCREERSVGSLKEKGDWDELWIKMMPVKTVHVRPDEDPDTDDTPRPSGLTVSHLDLNTVGLRYLRSQGPADDDPDGETDPDLETLRLMVLLKV